MKSFGIALFFAIPMLLLAAPVTPAPDYDASLVEVIVTSQKYDRRIPWRKEPPHIRQGYGVVIGPDTVLTTESLVRDQTQVELRRTKTGLKLNATVQAADDQRNLALLKFAATDAVTNLAPVALAETVRRDDRLTLVKLEKNGEFQTSDGQIVEISVAGSPRPLVMKVLTQLSLDGDGAPAFSDGRLAGLSVGYDSKKQIALCAPCTTLRQFIADTQAPAYRGLAWAGFQFESLLDPVKRRYLGVSGEKDGVFVTKITPGSGAAKALKVGDVILQWDGYAVDSQGYYNDPDFGRLRLAYLIGGRHVPGDKVPVAIIRDNAPQTVEVLLMRQREIEAFIPEYVSDEPVQYLVDGGLVLLELTGDYLRASGENWKLQANPRLIYYYLHQEQVCQKPGDHVVVLAMALPDSINVGYHNFQSEVVTAVNGQPVRNMDDVFRSVDAQGGLRRLTLMGCGVDLALDTATRDEANRRIAEKYRIPQLRYRKENHPSSGNSD